MSDDVWASLEKEAGGNYDEIWKVNQQFIDEQIAANKIYCYLMTHIRDIISMMVQKDFIREK